MRVIVTGSRHWNNRSKIADRLAELPGNTTVVHGGAQGADKIAGQEAEKLGLLVEVHKPDYERWSKKYAPIERNQRMAELGADLCLAFWDQKSTGTANMIEEATKRGIPVEVILGEDAR